MDETDDPRRAARAHLHLLPPGARARRAGRAHAADARRPDARTRSPAPSSSPSRRWRSGSSAPKHKIKAAGIPFRVPPAHLLPDRLAAVLAVVYLIFNEGYGGRGDLAAEAIRLGRALAELMPDEPEAHGAAGADAAQRRPPRGALRRRRASSCSRPGPLALGRGADRGGAGRARSRAGARRPRPLRRCRRRSPPCTRTSRRTGRRSPRSTASSPAAPARRWSSSTGPSRSPRPATPRRRSAIVDAPRPRRLPLPARDPRRAAAPARADRGGAGGLRARARAGPLRRRARLPRAAAALRFSG